jgi:hypothetical protein
MSDREEAPNDWQVPRFLWLNAWRVEKPGPEQRLQPREPIGYYSVMTHPDEKGFYCGLGILEDKRKKGLTSSISLELKVSDSETMDDVAELLIKVACVLKANPSLLSVAVGPFPRTAEVNLPDVGSLLE